MRFFTVLFVAVIMLFAAGESYSTHFDWLMRIDNNEKRFDAIQTQLRGFDTAMIEVGYRYEAIKQAITVQNYELASYHLQKIKVAIENGYAKRPSREGASKNYFLNTTFKEFAKALETKDDALLKRSFDDFKNSCNACHHHENVGFIVVE